MRIVIQRCREASVTIGGQRVSAINRGMLILLGIGDADTEEDIDWLCRKIISLRIFDDDKGVMNLPITEVDGSNILLVSQFTLMASTRKGCRPCYIQAARPEVAIPKYHQFIDHLQHLWGHTIQTGRFGADMQVTLVNDGPVTICIDSKNRI